MTTPEWQRTNPDCKVFVPQSLDKDSPDALNEHFLVFDGQDGSLMAVWTQSPAASGLPGGAQVNRMMFSRSTDEGETWSAPVKVAGPELGDTSWMASWGFPMVSQSGRIYAIYNCNRGQAGWIRMHTGTMEGCYSDDLGATWSEPQQIPMPKSPYDDPAGECPPEWIVWQMPERDLQGRYFVGYSHWLHPDVAGLKRGEAHCWTEFESVCEFMRFMNIDDNPEPRDIRIKYSAWGDKALRVPHRRHPQVSCAQEPSIVRLPDNSLFCVMRTGSGYIWWSQSSDDGETWSSPAPLLYEDHGSPLLNPVACDPIYRLSDGRYIILYHNNPGGKDHGGAYDAMPRHPLYASIGTFQPDAQQPVWFTDAELLMTTHDDENGSLAMYSSFTSRNGIDVLWYPDSKNYLLGKKVNATPSAR